MAAPVAIVAASSPAHLILRKGGRLFVRSPFRPDAPVPPVGPVASQLEGMIGKFGFDPVVGEDGEDEPATTDREYPIVERDESAGVWRVVERHPSAKWWEEVPDVSPVQVEQDADAVGFSEDEYAAMAFADRSHLVKKIVQDKNGRRVTRWVNPNAGDHGTEEDRMRPRVDAEAAVNKALTAPHTMTAADMAALPEHLNTLTVAQKRAFLRSVQQKVSGPKLEIANRILAHVRSQSGAAGVSPPPPPSAPRQTTAVPNLQAALDNASTPAERGDALYSSWLYNTRRNTGHAAEVERLMRADGMTPTHRAGDTVPFDPRTMTATSAVSDGQPVRVTAPGWNHPGWANGNFTAGGDDSRDARSRVEPAPAPPPPPPPPARTATPPGFDVNSISSTTRAQLEEVAAGRLPPERVRDQLAGRLAGFDQSITDRVGAGLGLHPGVPSHVVAAALVSHAAGRAVPPGAAPPPPPVAPPPPPPPPPRVRPASAPVPSGPRAGRQLPQPTDPPTERTGLNFLNGEANDVRTVSDYFGRPVPPGLIGALTNGIDGAEINIGRSSRNEFNIEATGPGYYASRSFRTKPDGTKYVHNNYFRVHFEDDPNPSPPPQWLQKNPLANGADMLSNQIRASRAAGISFLETHAARLDANHPNDAMNGYYTWPRLGYDGSIEARQWGKLQRERPDLAAQVTANATGSRFPNSVLNLMATKEGRKWWKEHGDDIYHMEFDLKDDSLSMRTHKAYADARNSGERD